MFAHPRMTFLTLRDGQRYWNATLNFVSMQTKSHWKSSTEKILYVLASETTRERKSQCRMWELISFGGSGDRRGNHPFFCHRTNNVKHKNRKSVFARIPNVVCVWWMNLNRRETINKNEMSGKESHVRVNSAFIHAKVYATQCTVPLSVFE